MLFPVFLLLFFISCNRTSKEIAQTPGTDKKETSAIHQGNEAKRTFHNEDFDKFYQRFHSDSLFQMQRIKFPMQGYTLDSLGNNVPWTRQNWLMHRMGVQQVDTTVYKVEIKKEPGNCEEDIYIEGGGFRTKRMFNRENGKWYLILFENEEL